MTEAIEITETTDPTKPVEKDASGHGEANVHKSEMSNADHFLDSLGTPFAHKAQYWKALIFSSIPQGLIMSLVALGFFNCYVAIAEATWLRDDYHHALVTSPPQKQVLDFLSGNYPELSKLIIPLLLNMTDDASHGDDGHHGDSHGSGWKPLELGQGEWWWVGLMSAGGLLVGAIKVLWSYFVPQHKYPKVLPGFLVDVRELKAHDFWLWLPVLACSAVSLGVGASVGPEMALGLTGTTLGSLWFARRWRIGSIQAVSQVDANGPEAAVIAEEASWLSKLLPDFSQEPEKCALDGITGAFGALFPSQYIAGLLVLELGYGVWNNPNSKNGPMFPHSLMEVVTRTALASSVAYTLFTGLQDRTLLESVTVPFSAVYLLADISIKEMFMGLVLGIMSGCLGLVGLLSIGVFGKVGATVENMLDDFGEKRLCLPPAVLGTLMNPAIGGALLGVLCVAVPLLMGDGADQIGPMMILAEELGVGNFVAAGFLKLVAVGISLGFGFVGGQIFPLIFAGTCMGIVVNLVVPDLVPAAVSIPCCMVAVPSAFLPLIFTMTILSSTVFALGGAASSPVFLACAMSYTIVAGAGVVHDLVGGGNKEPGPQAPPVEDPASTISVQPP